MRVEPYLYFNGCCEEAVEFYRKALAARVIVLTRFKDLPGSNLSSGSENKVAHVHLRIGDSTVLASDGQADGAPNFQGFSLSLSAPNDVETERVFAALAEAGRVQVGLMQTPFASRFGMVADRFGVLWTVVTQSSPA